MILREHGFFDATVDILFFKAFSEAEQRDRIVLIAFSRVWRLREE